MSEPQRFFEFDDFLLDSRQRLLLRDGQPVELTPKVFDVLFELVQSGGRVVEKKELMEKLWPDSFVEEANLTQHISVLRKKLGQDAQQRYILTVPGRGYRFVAQTKSWDDDAIVTVQERIRSRLTVRDAAGEEPLLATEVAHVSQKLLPVSRQRNFLPGRIWLLLIGAIVVGGIAWFTILRLRKSSNPPFSRIKLTRFTTDGTIDCAAISPNGKNVAYVTVDRGQASLWIRQEATTNPGVVVVPPSGWNYIGLSFSPDNDYIYFVAGPFNSPTTLYRVPALGGKPVPLADDVDSPPAFSPDSKSMVYMRGYPDAGESALMVARIDGSGESKLASLKGPAAQFTQAGISWSANGELIAAPAIVTDDSGQHQEIYTANAHSGELKALTNNRWARVLRVAWSADGNSLVTTAAEADAPFQVWRVTYPSGQASRITNDLSDYRGLTLAADSQTIAVVQFDQRSNVFVAGRDGAGAVQVTSTNYDAINGLVWTPDNRLVYTSVRNGGEDLWLSDAEGKGSSQLTQNSGRNTWPDVSADGQTVVFSSTRDGKEHIWKMDRDGNHAERVTDGLRDSRPVISPDGQWIIFRSMSFSPSIFKVPASGGQVTQLTTQGIAGPPVISADGKNIAFFYRPRALSGAKMAVMPFDVVGPIKVLDTKDPANRFVIHWTSDGQSIAYIKTRAGVSNIWLQPANGDPPRQLTNFDSEVIYCFALSRDGRLALSRGHETSDVVLISSVN